MNARVTVGQSVVLKRFSSTDLADAAVARATALQESGVATPVPTRIDHFTLRFPRVFGATGHDLLAALPDLLAPLVNLHRLHLPALDLEPFDPLARIRPRLSLAPEWMADMVETPMARLQPARRTLCHGDFHPAQVIRDAGGQSWLLDLDDLALGPVEADLGNLIGWLATQQGASDPTLGARLAWARRVILAEWETLVASVDQQVLADYITLAICRRALKRAEKHDFSLLLQVRDLP